VFRRDGRPQPKSSIHVNPSSLLACARTDFRGWIECPRVYVSGLDAEDCALTEARQFVCAHSPLTIHFHARQTLLTKSRKAQSLEKRSVYFITDYNIDGRCPKHPVILDVPPGASQESMTCRHQRREIRHRRAGH